MEPILRSTLLQPPSEAALTLSGLLLAVAALSALIGLLLSRKTPGLRAVAAVLSLSAAAAALALCLLPGGLAAQTPEPSPEPTPVGDPRDTAEAWLDALPAALAGAEGEGESARLIAAALRENRELQLRGACVSEGMEARQSLTFSALDLNAMQEELDRETEAWLRALWEERPRSALADAEGGYWPEVKREAWEAALLGALAHPEDFTLTGETELRLRWEPEGWRVVDAGALQELIDAAASLDPDAWAERSMAEATEGLVYARPIYTVAEDAPAGPAFDAGGYVHTDDPALVQAIADSAVLLLDGQALCWTADTERMAGSEMVCYCDETILVICWKEIVNDCCLSFCEVKIADGSQLRRGLTGGSYSYGPGPRMVQTQLARSLNAVASIDGDFYDYRELGITVYQRQLYRNNPALVDTCFFTASGDMLFAHGGELAGEGEAEQFIADNDVLFSVAFGPILVENGEATYTDFYPQGEVQGHYSRAAIGQLGPCHYLLMTCGFGDWYSNVPDINQTAQYIQAKGVEKAYTLDGGQTAEIYVDGRAYNHIDFDTERPLSDIIYFVTALPED